MLPSAEGKRMDGGQETPPAGDDPCQATVTSVKAMLAAPQHASEPTPLAALDGTARELPRSRHRSYSSAMGVARGNILPHLAEDPGVSPPMRRRRRRRQRKMPLWRRFRSLLIRCWSFVCFSRPNSADEHVRVRIRRDNGRTMVKTKLVGEAGFFAFDDDDEEDEDQTEEEAWEEWEPHFTDARSYTSGPQAHRWSTASPNASLGSFAKGSLHRQAVAGGLADAAVELYNEVDNVMQVFAKVLETIPPELSAQYLFTGLLGYGGNGFIAGALDRQTGAAVAVKFISKDRVPKGSLMVSDAFPGSIPVEAEILRVAHHPNIVGFHALHVDEHFFMIVMEQVTNFLRSAAEQAGAPAALPVSTEDAAILSIRSFGSADSIPLTQRHSASVPPPIPAQPARHPSRGSDHTQQKLGSIPRALSSSSSAHSVAVQAQLAALSDAAERIPSVSRPPPIRSNTNSSIPLRVPPSLPAPRQPQDKVSSPSLPQPTLKNLTRPRHGHPGDLDEFLYMYGPLHPLIQRRLCNQLISAYAHLANAGIAYLDFRGENIIVDREFNVRLVDFGMSQFLDSPSADAPQRRRRWISRDSQQQQQQQQRFTVYGTRPFSAPEILTGNGYLGPEADIWALGIIFYLVATGGIDPFASVEHILSTSSTHLKWPVGCTVAGPQKELIERMLAHLPGERPSVAEVCASEWLSERPVDVVAP
ncbi:hypothetical protein HDU88_000146 [Geranomyces variabilis]|nr:hypothetical protein HDU88_000146 [Geranomyces variabilis]